MSFVSLLVQNVGKYYHSYALVTPYIDTNPFKNGIYGLNVRNQVNIEMICLRSSDQNCG